MGQADLGVRVFLIDALTSPMGLLTAGLGAMVPLLMSLTDQAQSMGNAMYDALAKGNTAEAQQLSTQLDNVAQSILGIEIAAGSAVDFGLFVSLMETATRDAGQLQDTMNQLAISVQGADSVTGPLQQDLFKVANASIYTADQVGQGWDLLGEKGYTAQNIMAGLGQSSVNLAEAIGDSSTGTVGATNLLATAMEVYKAKAQDSAHYTDLLTYAYYNGIPSVDGLRSAFEQVGGRAQMLKIPLDQLVASLDMLGRAGMTGQQAGQSLNYALQAIYAPIVKTQNELEYLGIITIGTHLAPQLGKLSEKFRAVGSSMPTFDGTIDSLDKIFKAGQSVGAIPLSATFYQWAIDSGMLNNAFYNSNGSAKDLITSLDILYQHLKNKTPEEQAAAFQQLFNVRSSQGVTQLMHSLGQLDTTYQGLKKSQDAQGLTAKDAGIRTNSLTAQQKELNTTMTDFMAQSGAPLAGVFQGMFSGLNRFVGQMLVANPAASQFMSVFMSVGIVLSALGIIVGIVVVAMTPLGLAVLTVLGPALLVAGGIIAVSAVLAGLFVLAQHFGFLQVLGNLFKDLWNNAENMLGPALKQLQQAWGQLMAALKPFLPIVEGLAALLGGVLFGAIGALFGILSGVVHMIVGMLVGAFHLLAGVLNVVVGVVKFFYNVFAAVFDLLTGNTTGFMQHLAGIGAAARQIFNGIIGILTGFKDMFVGLIGGLISIIGGAIWGFVGGIIGFFKHLFDVLVGHSIIPDLVKNVIMFFALLPIQIPLLILKLISALISHFTGGSVNIIAIVSSLPGKLISALGNGMGNLLNFIQHNIIDAIGQKFTDLIKGAASWGLNFILGIANGIKNGVGGFFSQIGSAASGLFHFFGFHSPSPAFPDSDQWMPNMMNMFAQGIISSTPKLHQAMQGAMGVVRGTFSSPGINNLQSSFAGAGGAGSGGGTTTIPLTVDGKILTQVVLDRITGQLVMSGSNRIGR